MLNYYERTFPIAPRSYGQVLQHRLPELEQSLGQEHSAFLEYHSILTAISHLPSREETDPAKMACCFDVYWLACAGIDPAAFLERHGDRLAVAHLKDGTLPLTATAATERPKIGQVYSFRITSVNESEVLYVDNATGQRRVEWKLR